MEINRLLHLKNLIIIALADGVLDPMEKEFLTEKALILGLCEEELETLFSEAVDFRNKLHPVEMVPEQQLADAVLMAVLDGHLHEKEQVILHELARALGFSEMYVNGIIRKSFDLWQNAS